MKYSIIRTYRNGQPTRTIKTGLTLAGVREYFDKPKDTQTAWEMDRAWQDDFKMENEK